MKQPVINRWVSEVRVAQNKLSSDVFCILTFFILSIIQLKRIISHSDPIKFVNREDTFHSPVYPENKYYQLYFPKVNYLGMEPQCLDKANQLSQINSYRQLKWKLQQ